MKFEWIDFYSEFATKLLLFKNDRKALIERINDVYTAINMQVPKLESGGDIIAVSYTHLSVEEQIAQAEEHNREFCEMLEDKITKLNRISLL